MVTLLDLPTEIIASIFLHLVDNEDVFAARSSNKTLEQASFTYFGQWFRKKGFMLTTTSLNVLESIANHPALNRYVEHVWFNPDCYTFQDETIRDELGILDSIDYIKRLPEEDNLQSQRYTRYLACMDDHNTLLSTDRLKGFLVRSLRNLPNLETIGMRRSEEHNPWGWSKLNNAIGRDPRLLGPIPSESATDLSASTKLFIAIINAVAESNVLLKRLYTDAIEIDNVRFEDLPPETLRKSCSSLLYIEVNAVKAWLEHDVEDETPRHNMLTNPDDYGSALVRLFTATTQLKEVGLQIFSDRSPRRQLADTWQQSYHHLTFASLANRVSLNLLTRVKLDKIIGTFEMLQSFLQPCATSLRSLKLRDARLISSEDNPKPWRSMFSFMSSRCLALEYLLLYQLLQNRKRVGFRHTEERLDAFLADGHIKFPQLTLHEVGKEAVRRKLMEVGDQIWYQPPVFGLWPEMDDEYWHTDTSDEE